MCRRNPEGRGTCFPAFAGDVPADPRHTNPFAVGNGLGIPLWKQLMGMTTAVKKLIIAVRWQAKWDLDLLLDPMDPIEEEPEGLQLVD